MNKTTRTLAMSGIAIAAGLTMGVGPAFATSGTTSTGFGAASSSDHRWESGRVVGYFHTASACYRARRIGEIRNKWDDSNCTLVRRGFHHGLWQLTVSWDRHGPVGHGSGGHDQHGNIDQHSKGHDTKSHDTKSHDTKKR